MCYMYVSAESNSLRTIEYSVYGTNSMLQFSSERESSVRVVSGYINVEGASTDCWYNATSFTGSNNDTQRCSTKHL